MAAGLNVSDGRYVKLQKQHDLKLCFPIDHFYLLDESNQKTVHFFTKKVYNAVIETDTCLEWQ